MFGKRQIGKVSIRPVSVFAVGLAITMLSLIVSIPPVWDTFMHPWRIEFMSSALLLGFMFFGISRVGARTIDLRSSECWFIIVPISAFIMWSTLSVAWSNSPKSAVHHTLVWAIYLTFYLCVRVLLQERDSYSHLLTAATGPLLFFATLAILGHITVLIVGRGSALGIIYSKWGEQANTLLPLLLVAAIGAKGKRFYLSAAGVVLLWLMIYVSASRTAIGLFLIGFTLVLSAVFVIKSFERFRLKIGIIAASLLLVSAFFSFIPALFSDSDSPTVSRFNDSKHLSGSNDFRKLMITLGLDMIADRPVTGVGGDNFGFEVNRYRAEYAAKNPSDPTLSQAEMNIPERAHNEYLQIASELGIVGAAIFTWFLLGIAWTSIQALKRFRTMPPHALAASVGVGLFLLSSLVTSYSFRLVQNGLVFFFVLAVLIRTVNKRTEADSAHAQWRFPFTRLKVIGSAACVMMLVLCGLRAGSVAMTKAGHKERNTESARIVYDKARSFDSENPEAPFNLGIRLLKEARYSESAIVLRESIRIGKARSVDYSYLATAQFLSGDTVAAEESLAEATTLYPQSVFVLARYSSLLAINGKADEASSVAERARKIDYVAANTWLALIELGPQKASELAFRDDRYKAVMDLEPFECIYAVITERDIRFPGERTKLPFELASTGGSEN